MFTKRLTKPDKDNKYYIREPEGYNPCILGNPAFRDKDLNVLPNCTGWACSRFNEIGGYMKCKYRINMDAQEIYGYAYNVGLKVGDTPKVGALMVWRGNGHGHVAVVEEVISETKVLVSQSGWNSKSAMWTAYHSKGTDGNWTIGSDLSWMGNKYTFLGFVYHPNAEEEEVVKEITVLANGKKVKVKAITKDGTNYVRLRDFDDVLGIVSVDYDNVQKLPIVKKK